jgi:hypothetical protein
VVALVETLMRLAEVLYDRSARLTCGIFGTQWRNPARAAQH